MWYRLSMSTIRKQRVGKYTYWQIVESKRIDGKPRPIVLMHLGATEALMCKLRGGEIRKKIKSHEHGAVWVLWKLADDFGLARIFETTFSSQLRAGLNVGKTMLLGAIHRALKPGSKRAFSEWARHTTLPTIARFDPKHVDSQVFWDQMDTVTDEQIEKAEMEITRMMKEKGLLSPGLLFYDTTNFFTFIDTKNTRCKLPKRGKNKQKRHDLRQFGLAQIMTREFLLPVCAEIYEGNTTDSKLFVPQITQLRKRIEELNYQIEELTIVFDKGNNSKSNFAELDKMALPYVASLTACHHEDLINIPTCRYWHVTLNDKRIRCFRTKKKIWGKERTVVLYLSDKLRQGQIRGLDKALEKKYQQLRELKANLLSPRAQKRARQILARNIQRILCGERGNFLIDYTIKKRRRGFFDIEWSLDELAYKWVTEILFGKRLLVTCRQEWSEAEIIAAYQGQSHIERVFKHFKNPCHHAVRPQYHWTDQKIKVHTFICLTGLLLSQMLLKKAYKAGHKLSLERLLDRLREVRRVETLIVTELKGRPRKEIQLEEMDPELQQLYEDLVKPGI